nr:phosphoadenosine phosphosulfate reductase family protein [Azospirillum oleiclasticum]
MLDHFRIDGPAVVSFSGGRSSAYMMRKMLDAFGCSLPDWITVCFANTGLEHAETLDFVRRCEEEWGVNVHWLEYDPDAPHRTRIVDYHSASRNGEPFAALNQKRTYLPNVVSRYCTVELKVRRIMMFAKHTLGLSRWYSVVGLRADEPRRVERQLRRAAERRDEGIPVMPMADAGINKADVARFWAGNSFDLKLPAVEGATLLGNCVGCYLKGKRKLVDIFRQYPQAANWWIEQEKRFPSTVRPGDYCRFSSRWTYSDLLNLSNLTIADEIGNEETELESIDCACTD